MLTAKERRQVQRAPDARCHKGKRDQAILACLAHGLRAGEVANLKIAHVLRDGSRVRLRFPTGKTGRVRTVTLEPWGAHVLCRWIDHRHPTWQALPRIARDALPVFAEGSANHKRGLHAITTRSIRRITKEAGAKVEQGWLHPHALRHTAATILVHATSDIWKTAQFLGHSVQTCSRYYAGYATKDSDACADALANAS